MTRMLAVLLMLASPGWGQGTPVAGATGDGAVAGATGDGAVAGAAAASGSGGSEESAEAADPVALWEADHAAVLDGLAVDLDAFEYLARPLVVFADSPRQPQFVEQMRLIEAGIADLARRDVAVIVDTDPDARSDLRRALRPRGFALVLVDKDGRVALRQPGPTAVREVARAIDRTPIRQEELREGLGRP